MIAISMHVPGSFPLVVPAWFYALGLLGMLVALSAMRAEFRTPRARMALAALVLAVAFSQVGSAVSISDPCNFVWDWVWYVAGCWLP